MNCVSCVSCESPQVVPTVAELAWSSQHCDVVRIGQVRCSCSPSRTAIRNARASNIAESGEPCGTPLRVTWWCQSVGLGPLVHRTDPVPCHAEAKWGNRKGASVSSAPRTLSLCSIQKAFAMSVEHISAVSSWRATARRHSRASCAFAALPAPI